MRISDQQHRILDAVRRDPKGWASNTDLHAALFGKTWPRDQRTTPPLSPSQRASLSRSLRRLESRGLVERTPSGTYRLPSANVEAACG